eukprot:gene11469-13555_t
MEVPEDVVTCTVHGKNRGSRNLRYYPLNERVYNELGMRDTHGPFDSSLVGSVICKYPCKVQEVDEENTCSMHDKLRGAKNLQVYPPTREEYSKLGLEHSHGDFKEDLVGRL